MEEGMGSGGDRGSDVIKKKSLSGCLIIKKKVNGVPGFVGSGSKKSFESRTEKKRSRLVLTDSGSSDEFVEPVRRRVREDIIYERRRSGIEDSRMLGFERKRGGLDVFEFDEYNGFDGKKMRMDYMDDRLKLVGRNGDYHGVEIGSSRNVVFDGRKGFNNVSKGSMSVGKSKGTNYNYSGMGRYEEEDDDDNESHLPNENKGSISVGRKKGPNYSGKSRYEEEDDDDEPHLPISIYREKPHDTPNESIRLQGKNGVLKVMVNKKKQQGFSVNGFDYPRAAQRASSRYEAAVKKNKVIMPSFYLDSKRQEKPTLFLTEKSNLNSRKGLPILSSKAEDKDEDSESGDSEKSLKQEIKNEQVQKSKIAIDNEHKRTTPTESLTPPRGGKESKVKRGSGTEKQLLREKIRSMLLDRGWKIDYRPRRNRDYLDAVYINPAGTAYWSIIKAYDALQKQLEEEEANVRPCDESTSFTPLPEEIISKLTRQTRKKIERELKKKKRDAVCSRNAKEVTMRESANCTDSEQLEDKLSYNRKNNQKSLKGRLPEADHVSGNDSSDSLYQVKAKKDMAEKQSATNSHMIQGRKSGKIGRCTLLVRNSDKGLNSAADGYVPYTGKRTILSWLVDSGIVQMGEKVQYMNGRKTRAMLEGWITKDGIHCGCCSKILTISKFEIHAGSKQRQPFLNIYLESGMSLTQCQIDAWNKQEQSEREAFHNVDVDGDDPNDDTCGLCGDGGDLICCDGCPSTFHQSCLDIKMLPAGDWHCPNCTCKFCGFACWNKAKADNRTGSSLFLCCICEKKYHQSCSEDEVNLSVKSGDAANLFCGKNCQEIYSHLQKLLGVKHELESGFSWCLVHRMDPASERLQLGFPQWVECNSKLAVALSVMDECFLPIVDRRSGINLIHNVLYNCGSNFSRLNYSGFYTAILEKGDEIISAASIRIHGRQLAEMPFIGTRHIYRHKGMCRRLLSAIESALGSLEVEKLIIPAIAEHMHTWTEKFNFSLLEKSQKQEMRSMNMLVFPGTDMLQKLLVKQEIPVGSTTNNPGLQSIKVNENSSASPLMGASEPDSSPKHDLTMSESTDLLPLTESSSKANASLSASHIPVVPSNDIPAVSGSVVSSCQLKHEPASEKTPAINSISVHNLAEYTVSLKSISPCNEHLSTFVAQKAVLGQSAKDHTQSSVGGVTTLEVSAKAVSVELICDSVCETSDGKIEEDDATVLQKSVSVHDSVSCGTSESTLVESDMRNDTAVDLNNSCKVRLNDTSANPPKESVERLCAKDIVEEYTSCETSTVNIEEGATAIQNSIYVHNYVSHITSQNKYIDCNMSKHSAVDLNDPCEVDINETPVNSPKDSTAQPSAMDIVEDEALRETFVGSSKGDSTAIQNSLSVHDSVPLGSCESTHIDSDMTTQTAVDLYDSFKVNVSDIFANSLKDSAEQLSSKDSIEDDTIRETFGSSMEEDATATQNSVFVHDFVSRGACESTHIDSDMTPLTAVDLEKSCEVNVNDTFVNSPKDSAELLSPKDVVEYNTLRKTIGSTIEEDAIAIQNSVSLGAHESTHIDSDMTNLTAFNLENSCEVNVNDSFVNSHKDSAEQLSSKDIVEDDTLREAFSGTVKEDATAIHNSVSVNDSVSLGARESTHIDSDITYPTAVDLDNSCEVNVNDNFLNSPIDPAEQFSSKDNVEDDTLCETIGGTIQNDASAIQNSVSVQDSVSLFACESTHVDSDMTNLTAVALANSCEVNVNDSYVNTHKVSAEQLLLKDIVEGDTSHEALCSAKEDVTGCVHDSVLLGACESTHIDSDMTNPTTVGMDSSCEINVNDTFFSSHKDSAEQLSPKDFVEDDTLCETCSGTIKGDATVIENSVSVHNSVSLGACESTHIDSDMTNSIAIKLENSCEVNVNDALGNSPPLSVEQLSAKDNVEEDSLCETSAGNIEEDSTAIQNSVSRDTFASTYTDSDMGKHTAVDLDNACEVNLNDTYVISLKDSVEQSSTENTVKEDVTGSEIITQYNIRNVVDAAHEVEQKAAYGEPIVDPFNKTLLMNNTSQAIAEDLSELSSATDVVGDERKGQLKNSVKGDAQEVDMKIASIEPIADFVCDISVSNNICQALNENVTGSTSDERTKEVKSNPYLSDDLKGDLHVLVTEVASNSIR